MTLSDTDVLEEKELEDKYPDIYKRLPELLKRHPNDLKALIETVACNVNIDETEVNAHCKLIALDGNKRPRVNDFARYLAETITDFAIPRSEVAKAMKESEKIGSPAPTNALYMKARKLFTRLPNSGEGGEVLLSVLAEESLKFPQLFTKMVLKTNSEMHVYGSDGIHVGVNESNDRIALYWGESKLHKTVSSAVSSCFESISPFLLDVGGSDATQERDLQLMRDGVDLNDPILENALKKYLDPKDPYFNKMEYRGLCLVGFDYNKYPSIANTKDIDQLKIDVETSFDEWKDKIKENVISQKVNTFKIEIFCLPFPSVKDFREAFRNELGLSNE